MQNLLNTAVNSISMKSQGDYDYNFYPRNNNFGNNFGNVMDTIHGDFRYGFYPFPAPNQGLLNEYTHFGNSSKKLSKNTKKCVGYTVNKRSKRVCKVYEKTNKNGIVKKVNSAGKVIVKKIYKTKSAAKSALSK